MPTNQSSPWGGGSLRGCSGTRDSPTAAFKGSFRHAPPELPRANDPDSDPDSWSRHVAAEQPVSQLERRSGTQRPDWGPAPSEPQQSARSTVFKEARQRGLTQWCSRAQTPQPGPGSAPQTGPRPADEAAPDSSPASDLFVRGHAAARRSTRLMPEASDCFRSPPVPHPCLKLSRHQGAKSWNSSHSGTKPETRSTKRQTDSPRRSRSAKTALRRGQTANGRASRASLTNKLLVKGGPPAVLVAALNSKPQSSPSPRRATCTAPASSCSISMVAELGDGQRLHAGQDVAPCPAGALVGSVTNQISAIHLTREGQPSSASAQSPTPAPSGTEETLTGSECVMQVDGVEEEPPGELEGDCSGDDDSECYSIIRCSSAASLPNTSSIEEPMILGVEGDREERPALVPSLFPLVPPTLYFSTANEKVELLPAEQRRLLKWKMSTVTPNIVKHTIARSHFKVTKKSSDWLGCWGHHMKSAGFRAIGEHQKLNHFPGSFQIGRKDRLWRNLSKMQLRFGKQEFNFFPRTFILPQDIKSLRKAWEDGSSRQKWIVKPPASARGLGIQVIHKWSQLPRKRPLLVQRYLHKPYLIGGNKFDLRIYVYVTSFDPLRIYVFSDGLVRFASCKYSSSMKTLNNKFMHLTNYSVNKKNSEYQTNSDDKACQGHKWALKALWNYLGSKGINTTLIWDKIKDIVIKTIIASEPYVNNLLQMHVKTPYSCHELFGFDIMLDENLKPWILEVNISPSLHSNSALDVSIKGQMIRDLLNLAGFRIPPKEEVVSSCSSASSSTSSLYGGNKERCKAELSADEKVKRAFYLTQRYADQDFLSSVLDVLTPEDVRVLAESEDELSRRGEFERVFPSPSSSRYLRFFECPRYLNMLLDQWEQKYWNDRSKCISVLRAYCQRGIHVGARDPAHMWSRCSSVPRTEVQRLSALSPSGSSVVVSAPSHRSASDGCSDPESASVCSLPGSQSPGSSVTSSACVSPPPDMSPLPQHFSF